MVRAPVVFEYLESNPDTECFRMSYECRKNLYSRIESARGRPLLVYVTSTNITNGGQMSLDSIPEFCEQIRTIPTDCRKVDLMVISQGGDAMVAWRIISLLREVFEEVDILIPYSAQSAATILSFGADNIIMHPFACLGPIDPQVTIRRDNNTVKVFSVEDIRSYAEYLSEDCGVDTDHGDTTGSRAVEHLLSELTPTEIGLVKKSMKMSETLAKKLLSMHMDDEEVIEELEKKFSGLTHHGYTVGRKEAKESGLPVVDPDPVLEDLMWSVWLDLSEEMRCNVQFDPVNEVVRNESVMSRYRESIRSDTPFVECISTSYPVTVIESLRCRSSFDSTVTTTVVRNGLNMMFDVNASAQGWRRFT